MASGQGPGRPPTANRPYSLSKDEAYARQLQEEENSASLQEDEEIARQLQRDMTFLPMRHNMERGMDRPTLRTMTPITQLFASLVHHRPQRIMHNTSDSDDDENNNDSDDSTSTIEETTPSRAQPVTRGQRSRGGRVSQRSTHGLRPTETNVSSTTNSAFSSASSTPRRGGTTNRGRARGTRPRRGRGVSRGATRQSQRADSRISVADDNAATPTGTNGQTPRTMEPSAPPVSLALNRPELPRGETEPEIMILDNGASNSDARFLHIMRDPMLLILFLMGRRPDMMVPDDIDSNDYEALWELAERVGEVKNRGLEEKEMKTLPTRIYTNKTKMHLEDQEAPGCRVCLSPYKTGDRLCTLPCKHEYHAACVKEWLKRNASCPICRHDMKPS